MTAYLAFLLGALIPAFLVSRTIWAVLRRMKSNRNRLIVANFTSLVILTVIAGYGMAGEMGRRFVPLTALAMYGPAQAITLGLELWRLRWLAKKKANDT